MFSIDDETCVTSIQVKELNRNKLFRYVYQHSPVSKQDLMLNLSLSLPTINKYLKVFEDSGLIIQDGSFRSDGGRKAIAYKCNPNFRFGIGVYITQSFFIISIVNLLGEQIFSQKYTSIFTPSEKYGSVLIHAIDEAVDTSQISTDAIYGVCFSIPGIMTPINHKTHITFSPSLRYNDWFFEDLGNFHKYPYYLQNDANLGGFYEAWSENPNNSFAYLHIAGGVGGAIILNGEPYVGVYKNAGEFGHMIINPHGKQCHCGRNGCLEAYISKNVLSEELGISLEEFFTKLDQGHIKYKKIFDEYLHYLCIGINNIRLALSLDVIIAGEITEYLIPYEAMIETKLKEISQYNAKKYFKFSKNKKENASSIAAGVKIIEKFISKL